ncbi:Gfo/Idh/MocA family oxidoreductase [Arthrobacter bambusae]|uniref:Gfo/Idh/MocA family protein n=1 Tax=Arthrobacter bambusae TaxID=1338426 RepID=UPI001F50A979|nr:Gfo/Idh/MocA family oxidoreductase [Arthrobacter bambusae]MCI0143901.1 Gfo/Idh/MocA family oxidoreductase [Arthrobacter bambusae]
MGLIGCGVISKVYLNNLQNVFDATNVTVVADGRLERAQERAAEFEVPTALDSIPDLLSRDDVEIVVNLTAPAQHFEISKAALLAGKNVYTEKPLALTLQEGVELTRLAEERGLLIASAPDTILGDAIQTARHAIDAGWIGKPFGFTGHALWAGPASWHPSPEFLYQPGGGPILDNAPYTIAALVYLLEASFRRVATFGSRPFKELTIGSGRKAGQKFPVGLDTFVASALEMDGDIAGSMLHSMSVPHTKLGDPRQKDMGIEIYGTNGTIILPGPAFHDGAVLFRSKEAGEWSELPSLYPHLRDVRGLGAVELASSLLEKRAPRIDAKFSLHVFEVLTQMVEGNDSKLVHNIGSSVGPRGAGVPIGLEPGQFA